MTHADMIAQVFTQACVDALHAKQRGDTKAWQNFYAVADALQTAYPRETRAAEEMHGVGVAKPAEPDAARHGQHPQT